MNGLNQMIAQGVRPVQIESPLNQMAQFEQIRGAQQANMLRQQQMAEIQRQQQLAQRQQEQTEAMNRLYQQAYDPTTGRIDERKLVGLMAQGGRGSEILATQEQFAKVNEATSKAEKTQSENLVARANYRRNLLEGVRDLEGYINWAMDGFKDPVLGPDLIRRGSTPDKLMAHIREVGATPQGLQQLINESRLGVAEYIKQNKPQFLTRDLGGTSEVMAVPGLGGRAETVPGSVRRKTMTPGDMAAAQRAGGPERRLKQGERWNAETETIESIPGSDLYKKQREKFTDEYSGANTVLERTSTSVKKIDDLLANAGFKDLFGGYTAYLTRLKSGKAADARTRLESLQSDFKALGKEIISARGQSIGQITEREWPILEGLIDTLSPTLDEKVARDRLEEIKLRFERMQRNVIDTYETEFADSQFYKPIKMPSFSGAPAAPAASGGVDMNNPLLR